MKRLILIGVLLCFTACSGGNSPAIPGSTSAVPNTVLREHSAHPDITPGQDPCGTGEYEEGENGDGTPDCVPDPSPGSGSGGTGGGGGFQAGAGGERSRRRQNVTGRWPQLRWIAICSRNVEFAAGLEHVVDNRHRHLGT